MSVVPLHEQITNPCRKCGEQRDEKSPPMGRYARLCAACRRELADSISSKPRSRPGAPASAVSLPDVVKAAVRPAQRFQRAVEGKHAARLEAQAALGELNSALREIREAAQKLTNGHQSNERVERELEQEAEDAA